MFEGKGTRRVIVGVSIDGVIDFVGDVQHTAIGMEGEMTRASPGLSLDLAVAGEFAGLRVEGVNDDLIEAKIGDVLDVDIVGVLLGGWKKYRQLQQYRDTAKYPLEETILLSLAEHSIASSHHPKIEILAGEVPVGTLELSEFLFCFHNPAWATSQNQKAPAPMTALSSIG